MLLEQSWQISLKVIELPLANSSIVYLAREQRLPDTSRPFANWITFLNICQRDAEVKLKGPKIL
jgi:hypothetical protein